VGTINEQGGVCYVCQRDPALVNSERSECSHVDCPHRRKAWSERPQPIREVERAENSTLDGLFDEPESVVNSKRANKRKV